MNRAVLIEFLSIAFALLMIAGSLLAGVLIGRRLRKAIAPADRPSLAAELFEQMRDAALVMRNGLIVDANRAVEQLFGLTRDELLGKASVTLPADAQDASRIIESLRAGPFRMTAPDPTHAEQ